MKSIFKKLMALTLSLAMVGSTVALAAPETGDLEGTGGMEGYVGAEDDIFSVELPTATDFSFIMDPQGLIEKSTDENGVSDRYGEATFSGGTAMFFKNSDGNYYNYSDTLAIVNRGNVAIDVNLTATVSVGATTNDIDIATAADGFTVPGTDGDGNPTPGVPGIYLAVEPGTYTPAAEGTEESWAWGTAVAATEDGAQVYADDQTVAALTHSEDPEYKWDAEEEKYYTEYPEEDEVTYSSLYFRVTGAVNTEADWGDLYEDDAFEPKLTLTWSITADTTDTFESYVEKFTVTFDLNGHEAQSAVNAQEIVKGQKATNPGEVLSTDGYKVAAWLDAEGNEFDFTATPITADITLTAKWAWVALEGDITITVGSSTSKSVTITVPDDQTVTSVKCGGTVISSLQYSVSGTTLTLTGNHLKTLAAGTYTYTVTFSDDSTVTFTVAVNAK